MWLKILILLLVIILILTIYCLIPKIIYRINNIRQKRRENRQ